MIEFGGIIGVGMVFVVLWCAVIEMHFVGVSVIKTKGSEKLSSDVTVCCGVVIVVIPNSVWMWNPCCLVNVFE